MGNQCSVRSQCLLLLLARLLYFLDRYSSFAQRKQQLSSFDFGSNENFVMLFSQNYVCTIKIEHTQKHNNNE